jgi:hypothetical protein
MTPASIFAARFAFTKLRHLPFSGHFCAAHRLSFFLARLVTVLLSLLLAQNDLRRLITQIFRQVFFLDHPQRLACTPSPLLRLAVQGLRE